MKIGRKEKPSLNGYKDGRVSGKVRLTGKRQRNNLWHQALIESLEQQGLEEADIKKISEWYR